MIESYAVNAAAWSSLGFVLGFIVATLRQRLNKQDSDDPENEEDEP